jgi:DNA repair protein RadA/Sms
MATPSTPGAASSTAAPTLCQHCAARLFPGTFRCVRCKRWNFAPAAPGVEADGTIDLRDVPDLIVARLRTGWWDRNFGDPPGIPTDGVAILGGAPGAGKSTVALQMADALAMAPENTEGRPVLYLGAEENQTQIKARAVRLGGQALAAGRLRLVPFDKLKDVVVEHLFVRKLAGVVVDSTSAFAQDPEHAVTLAKAFKAMAILHAVPTLLVNQITKDGEQAGLMKFQHTGDISLFLRKLKDETVRLRDPVTKAFRWVKEPRILNTDKSRYGPAGIDTLYEMTAAGLIPVELPDEDEAAA